jgi:hypothetical protein
MPALYVDNTGNILCAASEPIQFGHPWGDLQREGKAAWLDVPEGEHPDDCFGVPGPVPALAVDPEKSAARKVKEQDKATRKAALDAIDHTKKLSSDELDLVCREWLKREKGL